MKRRICATTFRSVTGLCSSEKGTCHFLNEALALWSFHQLQELSFISTMNAARLHLLLHVFLSAGVLVHTFDPLSTLLYLSPALGTLLYNYLGPDRCELKTIEPCNQERIVFNKAGLEVELKSKLFGQHIVLRIILKAVTGFMNNKNPKKPLVLSLHGPTGTGKSFFSQLIAKHIYKEGMKSRFVHFFTSIHFPQSSHFKTCKSQLQQWIKGNVTNCERSIFIFDEMDKMHPGLIDSIKPYLDYNQMLDGVSYGKAIFIFISNDGGEEITETTLDFWKNGRGREELKLKDLDTELNNMKGGLWDSSWVNDGLVDFYVPFLPLERQHVVQCVMAEMKARGVPPDRNVAEQLAEDLVYYPKTERVFSSKGCKMISNKLDYYI